jgi:RNA polymerase sigma-70 factor (ECF subfamily)
VQRIALGDRRAFESLYRLYFPRLRRFLGAMLPRAQLVEEVLDDTMMVVWRRAATFDPQSKASTWIFGIAYRSALAALRRHDEPAEDPDADAWASLEPGPEQLTGLSQLREALSSAMAQLSPNHRAVVDLTYFHELDYNEIAEIMNCPVDTVKTRMFHARRRLRRAMAGDAADWL